MNKIREVIAYGNYFEEFLINQQSKVQDKIFKVIEIIETYQQVPFSIPKINKRNPRPI